MSDLTNLEIGFSVWWYAVIMVAIAFYAMLDGFDLGVGMLHLGTKRDHDRRIFLNAIGPVWDGNEVWLVVSMGALLSGFPLAYASILSSFYIPVTLLIFVLIFRAVAIEFRSKVESHLWRKTWDVLFFLSSLGISFGIGALLGNFVEGIPLGADQYFKGETLSLFLRPYPVLVGFFTITLFLLHGAIFLEMKTEGKLREFILRWLNPIYVLFILAYLILTAISIMFQDHIFNQFQVYPWLFIIPFLNFLVILNIPRMIAKEKYGWAFINSCGNIFLLMCIYATGMFPNLLKSNIDPAYSITAFNASSSLKTLQVLTIVAIIGLPLVASYMTWVYYIFRGKVTLDSHSY
jgi:cytochrome bd ubiquinol oxidase subunit II